MLLALGKSAKTLTVNSLDNRLTDYNDYCYRYGHKDCKGQERIKKDRGVRAIIFLFKFFRADNAVTFFWFGRRGNWRVRYGLMLREGLFLLL